MAASVIPKHFTDGSLVLTDGAANSLTVPLCNGDISASGLQEDQKQVNVYEARGVLTGLRKGAPQYPEISFTAQLADVSDGSDTTLIDFALRQNSYSGNTSTTTAKGDVYTLDATLTIEGTDFGDSADHTLTWADVHLVLEISEGEPNTISVTGTVYGSTSYT